MMTPITTIEFACESITTLGRQIQDYCRASCDRLSVFPPQERQRETARFVRNGSRLLNQMDVLIDMVRSVETEDQVDVDAMEQDVENLKQVLESVARRQFNIQN